MLEVKNLSVKIGKKLILDDISFDLKNGDWLMIIGPNGAGKSTLIKALSGIIKYDGNINLFEKPFLSYSASKRARLVALLSQHNNVYCSLSVKDVVSLGRYTYRRGLFNTDKYGDTIIHEAMERTGVLNLSDKSINELSGGELQRAFLAQVFAQEPKLLLLDEPTNHLDIKYEKQIISMISDWIKEGNRAVASIVHDLSLAKAFGNKIMILNKSKMQDFGEKSKAFSYDNLYNTYDTDVFGWIGNLYEQWYK